ncbi:MAG TPA: hypothetical protein VLF63_01715 [Patescibacteria group bacterium]|nr:hypothetical protein [Patescibacteria group bacterium]
MKSNKSKIPSIKKFSNKIALLSFVLIFTGVGAFYLLRGHALSYINCGYQFQVLRTTPVYNSSWGFYKYKYAGELVTGPNNSGSYWQDVCLKSGYGCSGSYGHIKRSDLHLVNVALGTCA